MNLHLTVSFYLVSIKTQTSRFNSLRMWHSRLSTGVSLYICLLYKKSGNVQLNSKFVSFQFRQFSNREVSSL